MSDRRMAQSPQQLVGQSVFDIVHPEVHERMRSRIATLRERPGNSVPAVEERVVTLDGAAVDVEVAAMSHRVDGHLRIQVVVRDVTELRRAEPALPLALVVEDDDRMAERIAALAGIVDRVTIRYRLLMASVAALLEPEVR